MKILVMGLDCACPNLLLSNEDLPNFRRLMEAGCFGKLESIIPPITVPAWRCMSTSQDPGSLGVYGFRNRVDYSYSNLGIVNSASVQAQAIWDQIGAEGKRTVIIGVPPGYPPLKVNGIYVSCFMTPDTTKSQYTYPAFVKNQIAQLVGDYPVDVKEFRTHNKPWLKEEVFRMTRIHFDVVRHFLKNTDWDYFQFVEIGLDRIQHGFWKHHDPAHRQHEPDSPYKNVIRDYYRMLDEEIGRILDLLTEDTIILVLSDHGAQRLDGGFCVNEWLVREGLLVLDEYPKEVTPFGKLKVNWSKTKVWSEGGYYARVFLNVKGREPEGTIDLAGYERFRDELKAKFEALPDDLGKPMGTLVFRPEEVYRSVNNVAPDLIVHFGALYWRSIGGVGYPNLHIQENDTGPDDCNHAQHGAFILTAPNSPLQGEFEGAHLLDIAPTLLELGGYDVPASFQGRSLVSGVSDGSGNGWAADEEEIVRERLSGLGYIG
ncbi:MAG: alkaline phosphatase family protein [Gemmataceae bacterium]|nr:alkaline phosphatase family protein [Gemmataceae bacterium]